MSTREKRLQVLMTPELRDKIDRIARKNRWSISSCAFYLLEHAVKTWEEGSSEEEEELVPVSEKKRFTQFMEDRLAQAKLERQAVFLSDDDLIEEEEGEEVIKKRKRKVLVY